MDWMNSKKEKFMVAGLDTFCVILENGADDFYILVPKLMTTLYSMCTNEKVGNRIPLLERILLFSDALDSGEHPGENPHVPVLVL